MSRAASRRLAPCLASILVHAAGATEMWGEDTIQRMMHHAQNQQYSTRRIPFVRRLPRLLSSEEAREACDAVGRRTAQRAGALHPAVSSLAGGFYSAESALYYDDIPEAARAKLEGLGEAAMRRAPELGASWQLSRGNFRVCVLRYRGRGSGFTWHYDAEPSYAARLLILVRASGRVGHFAYLDESGRVMNVQSEVGDGILIKGCQTYHAVTPSDDDAAIRWVLGFQLIDTSHPDAHIPEPVSLCNSFRGRSPAHIAVSLLPHLAKRAALVRLVAASIPSPPITAEAYRALVALACAHVLLPHGCRERSFDSVVATKMLALLFLTLLPCGRIAASESVLFLSCLRFIDDLRQDVASGSARGHSQLAAQMHRVSAGAPRSDSRSRHVRRHGTARAQGR